MEFCYRPLDADEEAQAVELIERMDARWGVQMKGRVDEIMLERWEYELYARYVVHERACGGFPTRSKGTPGAPLFRFLDIPVGHSGVVPRVPAAEDCPTCGRPRG